MSSTSNNSKPDGNIPSGLPLLYSKPTVLSIDRHANASISYSPNYSFASNTNSIALNTVEFIHASKSYPIVFTNHKDSLPVAIVGLEQKNYFVRPDNSWQENSYIPAYIRQYPFIFYEDAREKKIYLCVDEAAQHFNNIKVSGGNRLYGDDGKPTEFTSSALKFCTEFYQQHLITRNFCADLQEHKLLQPYTSEVVLSSGKKAQLSGFLMIDEKAVNALSNKAFLALRDKGWIPYIYLAIASTTNWNNLVFMESKADKNT